MSSPSNVVSILNPTIPVDQGIFEQSTTMKARLGTRLQVGDRVFRYAQLSTSANGLVARVVCAPVHLTSACSAVLTVAAATTGANKLSVTGSAIGTNDYAEGYVNIASTGLAGGGWMFRIKSHPAVASGAACELTLYDSLPGSVGAGPAALTPNQYRHVKIDSDVAGGRPVGVLPIAVTSGNYFWLQTWGPACPTHTGNTVANAAIQYATAGHVSVAMVGTEGPGATTLVIGRNSAIVAVGSQADPVFLMIEP